MEYTEMKNKDLADLVEERGLTVDSKNVSKPTKAEYITALTKDDESVDDFLDTEIDEVKAEVEIEEVEAEAKVDPKVSKAKLKRMQYNDLMAKKRVVITSNSKNQTEVQNQTFSWGNRVVGHQTDRVVFGKPWHVRQGALNNIEAALIREPIQNDDKNRVDHVTKKAYIVQYLDPLTEEQLDNIRKKQIVRDASVESMR